MGRGGFRSKSEGIGDERGALDFGSGFETVDLSQGENKR